MVRPAVRGAGGRADGEAMMRLYAFIIRSGRINRRRPHPHLHPHPPIHATLIAARVPRHSLLGRHDRLSDGARLGVSQCGREAWARRRPLAELLHLAAVVRRLRRALPLRQRLRRGARRSIGRRLHSVVHARK